MEDRLHIRCSAECVTVTKPHDPRCLCDSGSFVYDTGRCSETCQRQPNHPTDSSGRSANAMKPKPVGHPSTRPTPLLRRSTVITPTALMGSKMLICDFLQVNPDTIWQPSSRIILSQFSFQLLLLAHLIRPRTMRHVRLGKLMQLLALRGEHQSRRLTKRRRCFK